MTDAAAAHAQAVLEMYTGMPDTPDAARAFDRRTAADLYRRGVRLTVVETALLLASLRRMIRPPESPAALPPIRSLAYFLPVIAELEAAPAPEGYLDYLRGKLIRGRRLPG